MISSGCPSGWSISTTSSKTSTRRFGRRNRTGKKSPEGVFSLRAPGNLRSSCTRLNRSYSSLKGRIRAGAKHRRIRPHRNSQGQVVGQEPEDQTRRCPMAKVLSCRDAGVDCDFTARGETVEEILKQCVDPGRGAAEERSGGTLLFLIYFVAWPATNRCTRERPPLP